MKSNYEKWHWFLCLKTGYRYMWHLFVSSSVNVGPAWSVGEGLFSNFGGAVFHHVFPAHPSLCLCCASCLVFFFFFYFILNEVLITLKTHQSVLTWHPELKTPTSVHSPSVFWFLPVTLIWGNLLEFKKWNVWLVNFLPITNDNYCSSITHKPRFCVFQPGWNHLYVICLQLAELEFVSRAPLCYWLQ